MYKKEFSELKTRLQFSFHKMGATFQFRETTANEYIQNSVEIHSNLSNNTDFDDDMENRLLSYLQGMSNNLTHEYEPNEINNSHRLRRNYNLGPPQRVSQELLNEHTSNENFPTMFINSPHEDEENVFYSDQNPIKRLLQIYSSKKEKETRTLRRNAQNLLAGQNFPIRRIRPRSQRSHWQYRNGRWIYATIGENNNAEINNREDLGIFI